MHITTADKARCVQAFAEANEVSQLHVCEKAAPHATSNVQTVHQPLTPPGLAAAGAARAHAVPVVAPSSAGTVLPLVFLLDARVILHTNAMLLDQNKDGNDVIDFARAIHAVLEANFGSTTDHRRDASDVFY
jgi:hypothetical protein